MAHDWILLNYESPEKLDACLENRDRLILFYPACGKMHAGQIVDIEVFVENCNVLIPMKAMVVARRTKSRGATSLKGVYLEIIKQDAERYQRLCQLATGEWRPSKRRSYPRLRIEIPAYYLHSEHRYRGKTFDICAHGIFIRTNQPLPPVGQRFQLWLHDNRFWLPISLDAEVRWLDLVEDRRGMGIKCIAPKRALKRLSSLEGRLRRRLQL